MYIERNVFQLKFGNAKPALMLWKNYLEKIKESDPGIHIRLLTDVSGSGYTLIAEQAHITFGEAEPSACRLVNREDWKDFYKQFIPYCERSERTYYKLHVEI